MRATPVEALRKRRQCHDLRAQGKSQSEIQAIMDIGRGAVRDWLSRPRPTDEEIDRVREASGHPKQDCTGQVGFKSRFDPDLFARLRAESEIQGAPTNRVLGCAVRLYLEVMDRARSGGGEPIDVMGWRA